MATAPTIISAIAKLIRKKTARLRTSRLAVNATIVKALPATIITARKPKMVLQAMFALLEKMTSCVLFAKELAIWDELSLKKEQ